MGGFKDILKDLGWDSGFRIPVANEDNKQLEQEIEKKLKIKNELTVELDNNKNRIDSIDQYIRDIKVEHTYNQKLLTAYIAQYEAENHYEKLFEHNEASIEKELIALEKEKKETGDRIARMKKEIKRLEESLDFSKDIVALNKTKILQLEEILSRDEENEQLLKKVSKFDFKEFKKLDLKRQKLASELEVYKRSVVRMIDEIYEKEVVLERTAKFYTQALDSRRQLIERWTQSVFILRQRDNDIQKIIKEVETLRSVGVEKLKVLTESEEFLESQVNCNRLLEYEIKQVEKILVRARERRSKVEEHLDLFNLEFKSQRRILNELEQKMKNMRIDFNGIRGNIFNKKKQISDCKQRIKDLKTSLSEINNQSVNVEDRTKQLEEMIEKEEKRKFLITSEIKRFQGLMLRTMSRINSLESDRKAIELQEQGELRKIEQFTACQVKEEKQLEEKKESARKLDIVLQNLKIRLGKNNRVVDKEEFERKQNVIEGLQESLNDKKEISKLLLNQMIKLENEIKKVQSALEADRNKLEQVKIKKKNLELLMLGGEKQLKVSVRVNEEKQVAENIMELRVTQAEELMKNTGNRVYNLEQCHVKICAAMKERMTELKALKEALNLKYKVVMSECSELRSLINEKNYQTLHLQSRYDNIMATSNVDNTDGILPATTYLKIQNAQYKYELQERGDKLDATIRKTEQEIKSMENTLKVVNACNDNYKLSLGSVEDDSSKQTIQSEIDKEMCEAAEQMKRKKSQLNIIKNDLALAQENHKKILEDLEKIKEEKEGRQETLAMIEKQINDQKSRLIRADMRLKKLYKDIQRLCECADDDIIILQEKDISTREIEEQNLLGLQRVTEFTIRHVEAEVYVKKLISAKDIVLPSAQHSKPTPAPSLCSTRSSTTSFNQNKKCQLTNVNICRP
ncbi:coiled-coil domain-containing protein 39 [Microplitis mediator]|uniref:coiled-coil domain-containing protein 39 n=1 Tax=Microplitis mediator TaxID=375433 RepID=UPI0025558641|nr:coiled-coil domain-containing protein 39 [Microplitis mediator]